ncbi:MAG: DUF2304 domain-containing protein [Acidimicrobiales bacterium]|nr:DUF2304 domain-containing protein [Acidimicrobiales bacterium]
MSPRAHIFVFLVTVGALVFILRLVRRRQLRAKYAMLWVSVGSVLAVLATFPVLANRAATLAGVDYQPAALLFGAVAFLFLLVVHFSWELSRLEDRSRTVAEELAMLRHRLEQVEGSDGTDDETTSPPARTPEPGSAQSD